VRYDNDLDQWIDFLAMIEIFLIRYYRSSFAIYFLRFSIFSIIFWVLKN